MARSLSLPHLHGDETGAMDDDQMRGVSFQGLQATAVSGCMAETFNKWDWVVWGGGEECFEELLFEVGAGGKGL